MRTGKCEWLLWCCLLLSSSAFANHGWNDGRSYDEVFRCESRDLRPSYCRADIRGRVILVDQVSRNPCIEGRTWGIDGRGIWVSEGCRGNFAIVDRHGRGGDRGLPDPAMTGGRAAAMRSLRVARRSAGVAGRRVRSALEIQRQLSVARCDRPPGATVGIWVNGGCRADFVVYD
ncbi:MAG: DUF3011 domain-containing protein [Rhodanobacteraceae bacterium]|nr:DUF3011 domain-containing protein [Rhodanobacteraceae bacterium]